MCYDPAGPCTTGPMPGSLGLMDGILFAYGSKGASTWGIYNCRNVNTPGGSSARSVHGQGRAGDTRISPVGGKVGYTLAEELAANADYLELQFVIWARKKWGCAYDLQSDLHRDWLAYGGYAHLDHIHWEQRWKGARTARATMFARATEVLRGGEMALTEEQAQRLINIENGVNTLLEVAGGKLYGNGKGILASLTKKVDLLDENGTVTGSEHVEAIDYFADRLIAGQAEILKKLNEMATP